MTTRKWSDMAWDAWCVLSVIGIWPRFIEPYLLSTTSLTLPIPHLPALLEGLRIVQISDLHWNSNLSSRFLEKVVNRVNAFEPDLIFFTGDFLSRSILENGEGLKVFLSSFKASSGMFAVLGNHDYEQFVTVNQAGAYDVETVSTDSIITKGFKRLLRAPHVTGRVTPAVNTIGFHKELMQLIETTPFQLLHNSVKLVACRGAHVNVAGLGEYSLGRAIPKQTFSDYDSRYPGIVLTHNPDAISSLTDYPGELILAGHTHGGQINLPWMWKRFTRIENLELKRGLKKIKGKNGIKWMYINRGIGSVMPFRWFSLPEITFYTLLNGEIE